MSDFNTKESISTYNMLVHRDLFVFGDDSQRQRVKDQLQSLYFINVRSFKEIVEIPHPMHFLLAFCSMNDRKKMQDIAKVFQTWDFPQTHKVMALAREHNLNQEHLLFASEIGSRFVAHGPTWLDQLREYLKRVCIEAQKVGSISTIQEEIVKAHHNGDRQGLRTAIEKLKQFQGSRNEDVLQALVQAYQFLGENKKCEHHLKALLSVNPQNLWAANCLGRMYIKGGRVAQGLEILSRLSKYHELNGERFLAIGNAYARAGKATDAERAFDKGDDLNEGEDHRFKEGKAKVKLLEDNLEGAFDVLGKKELTEEVIAFLNLRAVMMARIGHLDEAVGYYEKAMRGAGARDVLKAKLSFNKGLALARSEDFEGAAAAFAESLRLGKDKFMRAATPLQVVEKLRAKSPQPRSAEVVEEEPIEIEVEGPGGEDEWESFS